MKKIYTSFFLLVAITIFSVTTLSAQSEEGPIEITSFADSTNIMAGDNFGRTFKQGDTIHIEGAYGNIANATAVWVTYDIYKPDWSGLAYTAQQFVANDSIGTLDGVIDFDYVIPEDAGLLGQFDDGDAIAFPIIQVRVSYDPDVNTFWNIFIDVEGEVAEPVLPLNVLTVNDVDANGATIMANQGESVRITGNYVTDNVTSVTAAYLVFNPDWSEAYSNVQTIADATTGTIDGNINFDYSIPNDAPVFGSSDDVTDPNMPLGGFYLLQVRVNTDPAQDIFVNTNIEVGESDKTTGFYLPVLEGLEISPNPADSYLRIITPQDAEKHISIFDASGKMLLEQTLNSNFLDISALQKGFHFIRVEQDGKVGGQKIMVE